MERLRQLQRNAANGTDSSDEDEDENEDENERDDRSILDDTRQLIEGGDEELEDQLDPSLDLDDEIESQSNQDRDDEPWNITESEEWNRTWDMLTAKRSINISQWEQFGTVKSIGGVHSGKIPLFIVEPQEGSRFLVDANIKYAFSGGQIYIPMSKKIVHNQDFLSDRVVPTLPAILMTLFANQGAIPAASLPAMKKKAVWAVKKLKDNLRHTVDEIESKHSNNCVRHEMFILTSSDGNNMLCLEEQEQDYFGSWVVSKSRHFMRQHAATLNEILEPLRTILIVKDLRDGLYRLETRVKAMLLLCAELAVKLAGFHPFEGRIMKQLKPAVEMDGEVHMWHIGRDQLEAISQIEHDTTGLLFGLNVDLLSVPLDLSTARPSPDDKKRDYIKLPLYIQMYQQLTDIMVDHPAMFLHLIMKVRSYSWNAIDRRKRAEVHLEEHWKQGRHQNIGLRQLLDDDSDDCQDFFPPKRNIFSTVDYKELSKCTPKQLCRWIERCTEIVAWAYDAEWFFEYKAEICKHIKRHRTGRIPTFKLCDFPATVNELEAFLRKLNEASEEGETQYTTRAIVKRMNVKDRVTSEAEFEALICHSMQAIDEQKQKQWSQSLVRNLLRVIQGHRERAAQHLPVKEKESTHDFTTGAMNEPQTKADILSNDNFLRVLRKKFMSNYRRKHPELDQSPLLIWHTTAAKYRKAQETKAGLFVFQPMVLEIPDKLPPVASANFRRFEEQHVPVVLPPRDAFPYASCDLQFDSDERNKVFKSGHTSMLSILKMRVLLYLAFLEGKFLAMAPFSLFPWKAFQIRKVFGLPSRPPPWGRLARSFRNRHKDPFDQACRR